MNPNKAKVKRKQGICMDCGIGISKKKNKRCGKCEGIQKRKDPEITTQEYRRNWARYKKYGMTAMDFEVYWQACKGECFICEKKMIMPTHTRGQGLDVVAVDHDHQNNKVRGLLCNSCNKALGFFKDDIIIIKKALKYLSYGK